MANDVYGGRWAGPPPPPPDRAAEAARAREASYGPQGSYRRRALVSLAVAALGVGAFLVGLREAVRRIPADAEERAAARRDSLRRARGGGATARPGPGGGRPQPEELPRLR